MFQNRRSVAIGIVMHSCGASRSNSVRDQGLPPAARGGIIHGEKCRGIPAAPPKFAPVLRANFTQVKPIPEPDTPMRTMKESSGTVSFIGVTQVFPPALSNRRLQNHRIGAKPGFNPRQQIGPFQHLHRCVQFERSTLKLQGCH
jgi:hypothetical protein